MTGAFQEGIRLFNSQKFFEAHEALEALWLDSQGEEKRFLHGLIQIAAAFHHYQRRNIAGFNSLLAKGCEKLQSFGVARSGLDLARFRADLERWRGWLAYSEGVRRAGAPPLPRLEQASPGAPLR